MCDYHKKETHQLNMQQFHPSLQHQWNQQLTAYAPYDDQKQKKQRSTTEEFIDWDDPYRNIRFWKIVDFFREFKLTK